MRRTGAWLAGLVIFIAALLTACGQAGSGIKQAVSSITASQGASVSRSAEVPPSQAQSPTAAPSTAASQPAPAKSTAAAQPTTQPTSSQAVVAPAATATATGTGSGSVFPWGWFWVIAGIVVVAGLAIWGLAARHRRHASAANDWRVRVIDAYAKGAALHDAMATAETPDALVAADAGFRWLDIQRRADDYVQLLYAMQQAAPGEQERILVTDVIASLQAVRSAMDAERSSGPPDGTLSGTVRDRIFYFANSLRSLRGPAAPAALSGAGVPRTPSQGPARARPKYNALYRRSF